MNINWRAYCRIVGFTLFLTGLSMLPSLTIAGIYHEKPAFLAFLYTMAVVAVIGIVLALVGRDFDEHIRIRDGVFIVASIWVLVSAAGTFPYLLSGAVPNFIDAFFESCSGFSTTGASVISDVESLPSSILFWRSLTQWMGALGILLFGLALMPALGLNGQNVTVAEAPKPTIESMSPKFSDTLKFILFIYIAFTLVETVLLYIGGMSLFDALLHSFSSVGTGGFSSYNDGIAHFNSFYIEIVMVVFMLLGSTNFNLYYMSQKQHYNYFKENSEFKFFIGILIIFTVFIALNLWISGTCGSAGESLRQSLFNTSSVISTTGFATADFNMWPTFSKMLLMMLMLTGGCAASAGGGIKLIRILILLKLIRRGIAIQLHPNAVVKIHINDSTVPSETVTNIANHTFLYIVTILVSTLLISLNGFDLITNFTSVVSCISNIGPGLGLVGPAGGFEMFSAPAKCLLSFLMLAGRLELFTLMIILTPKFWRPNH